MNWSYQGRDERRQAALKLLIRLSETAGLALGAAGAVFAFKSSEKFRHKDGSSGAVDAAVSVLFSSVAYMLHKNNMSLLAELGIIARDREPSGHTIEIEYDNGQKALMDETKFYRALRKNLINAFR